MFDAISFFTSRTGIVFIASLSLSVSLVWGYKNQVRYLNEKTLRIEAERNYQSRVAEALERQRQALDAALVAERKRRLQLEQQWKSIEQTNKGMVDYEKPAPASIINTLNSLSDRSARR